MCSVRPAKPERYILWAAVVILVTIGIARAQDTSPDKGEQIQNAACLSCHDLRPIQTAAYDKAGWTMVIDSMIQKGADVKTADAPVLIDFLVKSHGPLPSGAGKDILLNTCTALPRPRPRARAHRVA